MIFLDYWFKACIPRQGYPNHAGTAGMMPQQREGKGSYPGYLFRSRPPQYCDRPICLPAGGL